MATAMEELTGKTAELVSAVNALITAVKGIVPAPSGSITDAAMVDSAIQPAIDAVNQATAGLTNPPAPAGS